MLGVQLFGVGNWENILSQDSGTLSSHRPDDLMNRYRFLLDQNNFRGDIGSFLAPSQGSLKDEEARQAAANALVSPALKLLAALNEDISVAEAEVWLRRELTLCKATSLDFDDKEWLEQTQSLAHSSAQPIDPESLITGVVFPSDQKLILPSKIKKSGPKMFVVNAP
eukprot:c9648_g1_i3.p1 GENE.c9648_g1_i3~~c9648_g1_i3.p1  ORF type:complete len:167 (-),score=36.69 c9648_g1_i3:56-556(-)